MVSMIDSISDAINKNKEQAKRPKREFNSQ